MVTVHGTITCGYCHRALGLLRRRGIPHEFVNITGDRAARLALYQRTGRTSVPQIWIGERWIGGFRELEELDDRGELDEIVRAGSA